MKLCDCYTERCSNQSLLGVKKTLKLTSTAHNVKLAIASTLLLGPMGLVAQVPAVPAAEAPPTKQPVKHSLYFVDASVLDLSLILPPPPPQGSEITKSELQEIHRIEQTRTPEQIVAAQADDKEEDIFEYKKVIGEGFTADALPLTASLSSHVQNDQSVLGLPTKVRFGRLRPYLYEGDFHPVCATPKTPAYPSGHAMSGYLHALTLIQIVPEKNEQIWKRADEYAYNRMICGAHYKSDIEASRQAAYVVFGYMLANPRFAKELEAAREETRRFLGLSISPNLP